MLTVAAKSLITLAFRPTLLNAPSHSADQSSTRNAAGTNRQRSRSRPSIYVAAALPADQL